MVEDKSTNGTYLNDTKMGKGAKLPVKNGDKVWLLHPSKVPESLGFEFKLVVEPIKQEKKKAELVRDEQTEAEDKKTEKKGKEKDEVKKDV